MFYNLEQLQKVLRPMLSTEFGILTFFKLVQLLKVFYYITFN